MGVRVLHSFLAASRVLACVPARSLQDRDEMGMPPACEYGICIVDTPTASITMAQFSDDQQRTRLRTLLTQ